jgi:hypothetical protein
MITPLFPLAQVTPAALSFPAQPQATLGTPQDVTITNTGSLPLSITGLAFVDADVNDFLVGNDTCRGQLAPGATCFATVWFVPQAQGARSATLFVLSNAVNSPTAVGLSGIGGPAPGAVPGPPGPPGPKGATGAQGPAGTVVCRKNPVALVLCSIIFAPGTYTSSGNARDVAYRLTRHGQLVARGWATLHGRAVTLVRLRPLAPGTYRLTLTTGGERHQRTLLDRIVRIR